MLWIIRRIRLRCHGRSRVTAIALSITLLVLVIVTMRSSPPEPVYDESQRSLWLKRSPEVDDLLNPIDGGINSSPLLNDKPELLIDGSAPQLGPFLSPFVIPAEADFSKTTYLVKKPVGVVTYKNISVWDPPNELKALSSVSFSKCEYSKCNITMNHNYSDAVLFMAEKLVKADKLPDFQRKPGQYWVFRTMEAPSRFSYFVFLNKTGYKSQFNWTMSYRMDSDIPTPFGRLVEKYLTTFKDYDALYTGKTKSVAIFTTYCEIRSKSLDFVKKMAERIDVDIFGPCGTKQCSPTGPIDWDSTKHKKLETKDCFPMLSKIYKFYMVFENSICRDYVTEIFFQSFGDIDVVPVVRGGADYKNYFPSGSLIDASDYASPAALADFLADVGKDKDRYLQLLKTKQNYVGIAEFPDWQCKLCEKLHTSNATKTYADIHQWWTQIPCRDPGTDVPAL
uniref:Fucosyltransferase n=1 Tax=Arion vulgaris TaxID=1028688 RepID=A0A0B7B234_9EUPU